MRDTYKIPDFLRRQPEQPAGPRERPVLFSAPMVRAILAGTKTQTRRVVKQPVWEVIDGKPRSAIAGCDPVCPYGQPGDHLWVRENGWERPERTPKMMREGADTWAPYYFDADGYGSADAEQFKEWGFKRRPSIHMPRWASRILLEVVAVRVERLNEISETDAEAEGITPTGDGAFHVEDARFRDSDPRECYAQLWESINGAGSWDANTWVWVVEFKRIKP